MPCRADVTAMPLARALDYYKEHDWVALLRAIEVLQLTSVRRLVAPPLLDLGCGDGFVAQLAFGDPVAVGMDRNHSDVRTAAGSAAYRSVVTADARSLPFHEAAFQTVYSNGTLEHLDDLPSVLAEIHRVLRRGGVVIALVPSNAFQRPIGGVGRIVGQRIWNHFNRLHNHVNLLSADEWSAALEGHGLSPIAITPYGSAEVARFVSNRDLLSKVDVGVRWPFLRLRHSGNLARLMMAAGGRTTGELERLFEDDPQSASGAWLLVVARRS